MLIPRYLLQLVSLCLVICATSSIAQPLSNAAVDPLKVDGAEALLMSRMNPLLSEEDKESDIIGTTGELRDVHSEVFEESMSAEISLMTHLRDALEAERAAALAQRTQSEREIKLLRSVLAAERAEHDVENLSLLPSDQRSSPSLPSMSHRMVGEDSNEEGNQPIENIRRRYYASEKEGGADDKEQGNNDINEYDEYDSYFYVRNGLLAMLCIGFVALVKGSTTAPAAAHAATAPLHISQDSQQRVDVALSQPPVANRATATQLGAHSSKRDVDGDYAPAFHSHVAFLPSGQGNTSSTMRSRRRARGDHEEATGPSHENDRGALYGTATRARRGPALLGSHVHPLQRKITSSRRNIHRDRQDQSLKPNLKSLMAVVREQGQIVADAFVHGKSAMRNKRQRRSSYWSGQADFAGAFKNLLLVVPALFVSYHLGPVALDHATKPKPWSWSPEPRRLANRNCVMNFFIEKQPPDEYNPDFVEIKPGELNKDGTPKEHEPVKPVPGTHRTKGELHVISRYIGAVADSFRSKTNLNQHVVFAGVRDGGHLAARAMQHWPPRGRYRTQVHVIADDHTTDADEAALGYGSLSAIEERFKEDENAHVYDRRGRAGIQGDDDETDSVDDLARGDEEGEPTVPYPSLTSIIHGVDDLEPGDEIVVPYLHVDGTSAADQFEILNSARSLLESSSISAVAIEHSPDLELKDLIDFFREVNYKTFFLGSRQIARVDHLCEEVLVDVLRHPSVVTPEPSFFREMLQRLGAVHVENAHLLTEDGKRRETPPFFVAMPRGRRSKEEMTIQHMYDLFGGYGGGAGQVKTANDRKAPGK